MSNNKIFVGNVSFKCTNDDFRKCFYLMDGFVDAHMATKYNSVLSKGYGVVTFDTDENAKKMLDKNIFLYDRELKINLYDTNKNNMNDAKYEKSYKIYVAHPFTDMNDEDLKKIFVQFGTINVFYTKTDVKGQKYSIVGFCDRESIHNALNNKVTTGNINILVRPYKKYNRYNNRYNRHNDNVHNDNVHNNNTSYRNNNTQYRQKEFNKPQ